MPHKNARNDLTAEYVRDILDYDPETGKLRWKVTLSKRAVAGKIAGSIRPDKRVTLGIKGHDYRAHRLINKPVTGEWPKFEIDHEDLDPSNNRWNNLRLATSSQNQAHRPLQQNNTTGYKGVCYIRKKNKFVANIKWRRRQYYLGLYPTAEDAYAAYCKKAKQLHEEFALLP